MRACPDPLQERVLNIARIYNILSKDFGTTWTYDRNVDNPLGLEFVAGTDPGSPCDSYWVSYVGNAVHRYLGDDFTGANQHCYEDPSCTEITTAPASVVDFASLPGYDHDDRRVLYVATGGADVDGSHLWRTMNAIPPPGEPEQMPVFEQIDSFPPKLAILSILVDSDNPNRIFAGTDIGIFYSDRLDGEATWVYMTDHPATPVYDLVEKEGYVYSFTHGRGVFVLDKHEAFPAYRVREVYAWNSYTESRAASVNLEDAVTIAGVDTEENLFVARLVDGEPVWSRAVHGGYGQDAANAVLTHGSGPFEVTAAFGMCDSASGARGCVVKLDAAGGVANIWTYGEQNVEYEIFDATSVQYVGPAGRKDGYVVVGTRDASGNVGAWAALINAETGAVVWQQLLDGDGRDAFYGVATFGGQGIVAVGYSNTPYEGELGGVLVAKLTKTTGALLDAAVFVDLVNAHDRIGRDVVYTANGNYFIVGEEDLGESQGTGLAMVVSSDLALEYARLFGSAYAGRLMSVALHNENFLVSGTLTASGIPDSGFWGVIDDAGTLLARRARLSPWLAC